MSDSFSPKAKNGSVEAAAVASAAPVEDLRQEDLDSVREACATVSTTSSAN